uniref:Uncharacterized protein n=1 Tax=Rhizophora mucronata TaxID=61149 RepID=A0A2P2N1Q5_RHIMU
MLLYDSFIISVCTFCSLIKQSMNHELKSTT